MVLRIVLLTALVAVLSYLPFAYLAWREGTLAAGFFSLDHLIRISAKPAIIASFTILGILSATLFAALGDRWASTGMALRQAFSGRGLLIAALVAPIVIAGIYAEIATINSALLLAVVAYQNGFFWENVGALQRGRA